MTTSTATVDEAPDFASQRYSDAWDFSNVEDLSTIPVYNGSGGSDAQYSDGVFNANVQAGGYFNLVNTIPGSLPYGRDGRATPIDSGQYKRFSVRMWSSRADVAQVWWKTCADANTACYGASQFATVAGWGTYDIALNNLPGTAAAWSGPIVGIRIDPVAANGGRMALDWVRLYEPKASSLVTVNRYNGSGVGEIVVDQDSNPTNGNETLLRRDGQTLRVPANGSVQVDTGALAPGSWWLGVKESNGSITYSGGPVTVNGAPRPSVIDPDETGGTEVHDVLGGSAWDFNEASDVQSMFNIANARFSGGQLFGQNANPYPGDNQMYLSMPPSVIDGSRFHRITFTASYDGGWGLEDAPGGGMNARFIWQVQSDPGYQDLNDILITPGRQTITLDLASSPPTAVVDGDTPKPIGWAGQQIKTLRFDPNEDPGTARTWSVDDIRLTQDDQGGNSFNVRFQDNNWAPNTVADIYVDRGGKGQNRTQVASGLAVGQGVNSFQWNKGDLPTGTYWVLVAMRRGTTQSSSFSTGPVQMVGSATAPPIVNAPTPAAAPFGVLDAVAQVGADGVRLVGWTIDPALGSAAAPVHLYVDGRPAVTQAGQGRSDVGAVYGQGSYHGFDGVVTGIGVGQHTACAYAYRASGSTQLGCQPITVSGDAIGNLDAALPTNGGIRVDGWTLDRSTGNSTPAHVYVDGRLAGSTTANLLRGDVASAYPEYGPGHGFSYAVPAAPGSHTVCVYGINQVPPGDNAFLGCRSVTVAAAPFGALDGAVRNGNRVDVSGWALDPQTLSPSAVHIYVDGIGAAVLTTGFRRGDVMAAFPGYYTSTQGFRTQISVGGGAHTLCAYGVGSGGGSLLGCRGI